MAEGVRIVHKTERSVNYVVNYIDVPFDKPLYCHRCEKSYSNKHGHYDLDEHGAVLVSIPLWEKLQRYGGAGFELSNVVNDPPPIGVNMVDLRHDTHRNPDKFQSVKIARGRREKKT